VLIIFVYSLLMFSCRVCHLLGYY